MRDRRVGADRVREQHDDRVADDVLRDRQDARCCWRTRDTARAPPVIVSVAGDARIDRLRGGRTVSGRRAGGVDVRVVRRAAAAAAGRQRQHPGQREKRESRAQPGGDAAVYAMMEFLMMLS